MGEAWRAVKADTPRVLWRDARYVAAGLGMVERWEQDRMILSYRIEDLPYLWAKQGEIELSLVWKGSDPTNRQPYASCPVCGRAAKLIVLREHDWGCSACHALPNRSRQVSAEVRATEKLASLANAVRAAAWQGSDATVLRQEHAALRTKLGAAPITASLLYAARITAEWVAPVPRLSASS